VTTTTSSSLTRGSSSSCPSSTQNTITSTQREVPCITMPQSGRAGSRA
jgi:hypothetical protein